MSRPQISHEVELLDLNVMPFPVLAHVARLIDGSKAVTAPLSSMAATCRLEAPRVRHSLRELSALGCLRVAFAGPSAHVALTDLTRGALVTPAWVDGAGLSPAAVRVLFHHAQHPDDKQAAWDVGAALRLSPTHVRDGERELITRRLLEPRGWSQRSFVVTPPSAGAVAEVQDVNTRKGVCVT